MTTILGSLFWLLGIAFYGIATALWAYHCGKRDEHTRAFRDGYQEGFTDAQKFSDLWWEVAQQQVQEQREAIWREEVKEGLWP